MKRKFIFSTGEFYHIYNRGNNKTDIFLDANDRQRFLKLLYICNGTKPVIFKTIQGQSLEKIERGNTIINMGAYCLMPNHFHIIAKEKRENGISIFMSKLLTAYSMYFNKKYDRTGKLFENTFRATHIDNDRYFEYLFAYVHLNPIKILEPNWKDTEIVDQYRAKKYLQNYYYSSYIDYTGDKRIDGVIINKSEFPEYFKNFKEFNSFIDSWISFK